MQITLAECYKFFWSDGRNVAQAGMWQAPTMPPLSLFLHVDLYQHIKADTAEALDTMSADSMVQDAKGSVGAADWGAKKDQNLLGHKHALTLMSKDMESDCRSPLADLRRQHVHRAEYSPLLSMSKKRPSFRRVFA